ncbi:MAG: acyloxyacyl hydrolase [Hymenobacter sp.]
MPVAHLVASHPTGFELNAQRQTTGAAPWHGWYRYPKVGLALVYYDYHNPVLGRSYAASVYLSKALSRTARHDLSFRLGTGPGVLYAALRPVRQPQEQLRQLGAECHAAISAGIRPDPRARTWACSLGLGLNHYSNGATAKPNYGINLPTVLLGLNYHQQRPVPTATALAPAPPDVGHTFWNLSTSLGYKQRSGGDPRHYLVTSVTLAAGRRVNRKSNLLVGVEGFYDRSLRAVLRDSAQNQDHLPDVKKASGFVGHELLFGRLAVVTHLGFYGYNPYKSNAFFYERIGLKYQFTNLLFADIDLKAHRTIADVIEFKVGVKL